MSIAAVTVALAFPPPAVAQDALWVGRIGVDTALVEATRTTGTTISGTIVNVAAGLIVQRYEAELDGLGNVRVLRSWGIDLETPDTSDAAPSLVVEMGTDSIRVTQRARGETHLTAVAAVDGAVPIFDAFFNNPIALMDIAFRQAVERGDGVVRLYYIGSQGVERLAISDADAAASPTGQALAGSSGRIGFPYVLTRQYPMLEDARLLATIEDGRLSRFDARETTFKIVSDREPWADAMVLARDFRARGVGAGGFSNLSPARRASGRIGDVDIEVSYGQPSRRGRRIFPDVVPFGSVWRAGANAATQISFSTGVRVGAELVPEGSYTLWVLPGERTDTLILNRATQIWGVMYDAEQDLVRVPMRRDQLAAPVEALTYDIVDEGGTGRLVLSWDDRSFSVAIEPMTRRALVNVGASASPTTSNSTARPSAEGGGLKGK